MFKPGLLHIVAVPLLGAIAVCPPLAPASWHQNPYAVSIEVGLVVVPVAVRKRDGSPVTGLPQADFRVFEDGVPQEILQFDRLDAPVAVGLLLDNSGSMRPKLGEVALAAVELARDSNPRDQMFVIHFNEDVEFGLPVGQPFTNSLPQLEAAVSRTSPAGRTALYDAVVTGLKHLEKSSLKRKALVVVSDGGDNASRNTLRQAEQLAAASDAVIYAISIADETSREVRPAILRQLSRETGGLFFTPQEVSLLPKICQRIATDQRTQYTLGYMSSNRKRDGTFRHVRVLVETPDHRHLSVRTRAGYLASNDPDRVRPSQ